MDVIAKAGGAYRLRVFFFFKMNVKITELSPHLPFSHKEKQQKHRHGCVMSSCDAFCRSITLGACVAWQQRCAAADVDRAPRRRTAEGSWTVLTVSTWFYVCVPAYPPINYGFCCAQTNDSNSDESGFGLGVDVLPLSPSSMVSCPASCFPLGLTLCTGGDKFEDKRMRIFLFGFLFCV